MAHNIGQMFYYGETPWHRLGKRLAQPANMEEALAEGGLDWSVSMAPLTLEHEHESAVPQRMAVLRSDVRPGGDGRVLGVVHPEFKLLQNRDGAQLFDSLFGKGGRVYHTGGYLKRGEVVWLMAKLPESIRLPGDDELETYLLFSNSHDGSLPIDIRLTTVRVVCNNTLSLALSRNTPGQVFRRGHSGSYELVKAQADKFFDSVLVQQKETAEVMGRLVRVRCSDKAFEEFLARLLPVPVRPATAALNTSVARAHDTRSETIVAKRDEIMTVHLKGHRVTGKPEVTVAPAEKTWWGGLNSITAWVDHVNEIQGDRYANAMFGLGDRLKTQAYQRILVEAGAP